MSAVDVGPVVALQSGVIARLFAVSDVTDLLGGEQDARIRDRPEDGIEYPYAKISEAERQPDLYECLDGNEIILTVEVFTQDGGQKFCRRIGHAIVTALHGAEERMSLAEWGYNLVLIETYGDLYRDEPDGITAKGILSFRALVDPL